jgi:hypothetical protein
MYRNIVKGTSPNENKLITVFEIQSNNSFKCYNTKDKYFTITVEQKTQYRKQPRSSPYIFIKKNEKDQDLKYLSIRKQCKKITEEADKLFKLTDGKINLFRTGSVAKTALQLFYDLCNPPIPEQIESYEVDIFEACRGALIWAEKYKGIAYKYDICSEYPSLMVSSQHKYPIGKGTLKTFTTEEFDELTFYSFGIYHVKVWDIDKRLFKENHENWYTHTDLNYAKTKLKLKISLIEDDEPNALLYDNSKLMTGKKLFGPFVNYLFEFKKAGHKEIKKYLNCLWGTLSQADVMSVKTDKIFAKQKIMKITPDNDGNLTFDFVLKHKYYELDFARIKPFLFSYGRTKISNVILSNIDDVVRLHTDGFMCKSKIKNIKFGDDLGNLKYEGKGEVEIINCINYTWKDIK